MNSDQEVTKVFQASIHITIQILTMQTFGHWCLSLLQARTRHLADILEEHWKPTPWVDTFLMH